MKSEDFKAKKKVLLIAPLFFIPFLCLLFWAMGGGKGDAKTERPAQVGINTTIPKATNNQILQKDQAYQKLLEDSLRKLHLTQNDNYIYSGKTPNSPNTVLSANMTKTFTNTTVSRSRTDLRNSAESNVDASLRELKDNIARTATENQQLRDNTGYKMNDNGDYANIQQSLSKRKQELEEQKRQLEEFLSQSKLQGNTRGYTDPNNIATGTNRKQSWPTPEVKPDSLIYRLSPSGPESPQERFYDGITMSHTPYANMSNTIPCVVAEDQTVTNGAMVKLRLIEDARLEGALLPKNMFLYGIAQIQTERLALSINSVIYGSSIYPVRLAVFDMDGLAGIRIPGGQDQSLANQGKAGITSSGLSPLSNGLFINQSTNTAAQILGQAGSATLQAGQNVLSRKLTVTKVFLKANYHILLKQS